MKTFKLSVFYRTSAVLLTAVTLYSCTPGGSGSTRKKMPEFNSSQSIEGPMPFDSHSNAYGNGSFGFTTNNVDMELDGNTQQFVSVALPNSANDSLAISLVNRFKPLALPLLTTWAQQQRHGVVIDLSNHSGSSINRTDYTIEKDGDFSIPVIIMWDQVSAPRVAALKAMAQDVPTIKFTCTAGVDPSK